MFDLRLSEEQRQFQKLARDFAQKEIKPFAMALDKEPEWEKRVPWELLKDADRYINASGYPDTDADRYINASG